MAHLKFLENNVILWFERCFSKQNSAIRLKSYILPSQIFCPPKNFWAGYATNSVKQLLRHAKIVLTEL